MKVKDLQGLSKQELEEKRNDLHKQLMELQFKRRSGVEKPHLFKQMRRDIARVHTVMRVKEEVVSAKR